MNKDSRIYIAGHNGMVGSALLRKLISDGYSNIITRTSQELDLRSQMEVNAFFEIEKPEYVFLAAAKVGGILANNTFPAEFLYDNLMIETNVIHSAYKYKSKKLLFLGSSCIYPKHSQQPIKEEYLLTGELEPTNQPYAIAKITGIELCKCYRRQYGCDFISVMPTNLFGINDNFDLQNAHVLPALLRKIHEAKVEGKSEVEIWGTGKAMREFLYVDDLADASVFLMLNYSGLQHVNVGVGKDISIEDLVKLVAKVVGYNGQFVNDLTKPDGTPQKLLDVSLLKGLGWEYKTSLESGITKIYDWYLKSV